MLLTELSYYNTLPSWIKEDILFLKFNETRANEAIKSPEVFLIDMSGTQIGRCSISQALQMAKDQGMDLVEVAPNATPPVCKVLDFGKYKYEQGKKNRTQQKKQQILKEIRMQPKISEHDLQFKTRHVQEFLEAGNKVKVTIRFRGRELSHTEIGVEILNTIKDMLTCNFNVDKDATMEGRMMSILLSPSTKK